MKVQLLTPSPALSIQSGQLSLLRASSVSATDHAGTCWPMGLTSLKPVIRLLTAMLLCSAASASAELVPSPLPVDFGYQRLGFASPPMATTLRNTGNESVTVTAVSNATGIYARVGGTCGAPPFTIAAQSSCTIEHTFTPDFEEAFYQTYYLTLAGGDSVGFSLRGEGALGLLRVRPSDLQWFFIPVGTIGEEKLAYLENDGRVPLTVTEIRTSSVPAASAFVQTGGNCPTPPFELVLQCAMFYTFVPAQVGQSTMELDFDAGRAGTRSLSLSGVALEEIPLFKNGFDESALAPIQ